ncbi:hypothetical protein E2C01_032445 [Portunus trituberculatus]|uniref:Uncharacterized protein n=1 Tax=Portunus trituberculatus TaxID=210409 RepID=A0A5B7F0A0_PORTR|nr:hypothetical protein [Portunus trituberculatus]
MMMMMMMMMIGVVVVVVVMVVVVGMFFTRLGNHTSALRSCQSISIRVTAPSLRHPLCYYQPISPSGPNVAKEIWTSISLLGRRGSRFASWSRLCSLPRPQYPDASQGESVGCCLAVCT